MGQADAVSQVVTEAPVGRPRPSQALHRALEAEVQGEITGLLGGAGVKMQG